MTRQSNLNIILTRVINTLPEVITTAFGIKREQATTPYSAQVITADVINIIPQTNLNDALEGKIAGAQVRAQSGVKLNSQAFARIRGGLSLSGDAGPYFVVDGTIITDPYDIDPAIIENVTVLKGANETALFGGFLNGAIVVTTKKGVNGKSSVHLSQGVSMEKVGRLPEFQNMYAGGGASDLIQYVWQPGHPEEWKALDGKYFHDYTDDASWGPKMEGQEYVPWYSWVPGTKYSFTTAQLVPQPDNIKDFWETGLTSNTNISFSKSGQDYSTILSYSKQVIKGVLPDAKSDRNIVTANMNLDVNKFISTGVWVSFNTQKIYGNFNDGFINSTTGNFYQWNQRDLNMGIMKELRGLITPVGNTATWNWHHNPTAYDPNNPTDFYRPNYWFNFYTAQDNTNNIQRRNRIFGSTFIKVNINNNLNVIGRISADYYNAYQEHISNSILGPTFGSYATGQQYQNSLHYELLSAYSENILKNLRLHATAGASIYTYINKSTFLSTQGGLYIPGLYDISNSLYQPATGNGRFQSKTNAVYAAGDFEYKKLITANWSIRNTWYSTLPNSDNSVFCGSTGLAFIPTQLIKGSIPWLPFAKIYTSWGQAPLPLSIYQTNTSFYVNPYQWNGTILMTAADVIPDQHLTGGMLTSFESGIDLRLFKYRLGVNVNYYHEVTSDQPVQINVDAVSGVTGKVINAASVRREGIEIRLNAEIIAHKNFSWNLIANTGWLIDNRVTKIIEGQDRVQPSGWKSTLDRNSFASAYEVLGEDWGQLIGGGYARNEEGTPLLDPTTGLYVAADANYNWGCVVPKLTGGVQSFLTYKNVSFNFSLDYQHGGKFYSCSEYWGNYSGVLAPTAVINDRGMNVRDPASDGGGIHVMGVSATDGKTPVDMYVDGYTYFHQFRSTRIAEPYIHSLSYIKLRELAVACELPVKKWAFTNKYIQAANIGIFARNPWLIYTAVKNFDPSEISQVYGEEGQNPPVHSYGINLSFTF